MTDRELQEYIENPLINVFDITDDKKSAFGFDIHTYKKPNETEDEFIKRDEKNLEWTLKLKKII